MTNIDIIEAANTVLSFTRVNCTVEDFNGLLPNLRVLHGDLERHESEHLVWVTKWDDHRTVILELDKNSNEMTRYY